MTGLATAAYRTLVQWFCQIIMDYYYSGPWALASVPRGVRGKDRSNKDGRHKS